MRLFIGLMLMMLAALCSCGGGSGAIDPGGSGGMDAFEQELAGLDRPAGVDPVLWESLKTEFRGVMKIASSQRSAKHVPNQDDSAVSDLHFTELYKGGGVLSWSYVNAGDYNQDKLVNATDMTPIGMYYGAKEGDDDWDEAALADGNGDGAITVNDITPLGFNYLNRVEGYHIYSDAGGTQAVGDAAFEEGAVPEGGYRLSFDWVLASPEEGASYTVRPYDGQETGQVSNAAVFATQVIDVEVSVPEEMMDDEVAQWEAVWSEGQPPFNIYWRFNGGADDFGRAYAASPDRQRVVMHNLNGTEPATCEYEVTVVDARGLSGIAGGEYTVEVNPYPDVTVTVPEDMIGDKMASWSVEWTRGVLPYTVTYDLGDGADSPPPEETVHNLGRRSALMLNESRIETVTHTYSITVTDSLGYATTATGDYVVGPNNNPLVTVQVPPQVNGGEEAVWEIEWVGGTAPHYVMLRLEGNGNVCEPIEAESPFELPVIMTNHDMENSATFAYMAMVNSYGGGLGFAEGEYTVGPGPNVPPRIDTAVFHCEDQTLDVTVSDPNPNQTLHVSVSEPEGFHTDAAGKFASATGPLSAQFTWTVDPPGTGMWGTTTVTVEDPYGATATRDVLMVMPAPDTLYAVPMQTSAAVNEPVDALLLTGAMSNPFSYLCMVGLTIEPGGYIDSGSINLGCFGGEQTEPDGIWAKMPTLPSSAMLSSGYLLYQDGEDGRRRFELTALPIGIGPDDDLLGQMGDLLNFQLYFSLPGTYTLRFVESTGGVNRTYYSDWDEYEYYWDDITNDHPGLVTTIEVE